MSVEIVGMDAAFAAMDAEITRITLESDLAIEETCQLVEQLAQARCPVGTPESTGKKDYVGGTLKASIAHEHEAGSLTGDVGSGTEAPYGPFVEHGTYKMRAQPFMTPASVVGNQYLDQRLQEIMSK
jgi:HK97 gp10 family phage protein